ncbi:MAG: efflux RND transporter periplasmic adaptor subunit [Halopseudomonas sp.]|uniref:efflux RND transporter periplasmic adaptor subunit n=1 Tax=Halopseudomonas sp. TaxID=2901191 RepID=UPI0030039BAA
MTLLGGCSDEPETAAIQARPVKLFTVADPSSQRVREFPARLKAPEQAELSFRLGGELQALTVLEGQEVKKGELIAQLDDTDYKLKLSDRQANYDLTQSQFARMQQLLEKQMVSRAEYDQRKAQFNSAEAALNLARQELAYTQLHAPFDGIIARTHVEQYQVVQPNQPIATLYARDRMDVVFQVPESLLSRLRRDLVPADIHPRVRLDHNDSELVEAIYKEHASQPDPKTLTYDVTLSMPMPEGAVLLPGMSATVVIDFALLSRQGELPLVVPVEAVFSPDSEARDQQQVWVTEEIEGELQVVAREVEVGRLTHDGIEVTAGLKPGEQIVAAGGAELQAGQRVRPWVRERGL